MKLFIKRDTTDLESRYYILDDKLKEKYLITGKHTASGDRIKLLDMEKNELLTIRKIPLPVLKAFSITKLKGEKKNIGLIVNSDVEDGLCYFHGISWRIRGSIHTGSYDIMDVDNTVIASNIRRWSSSGTGFELNINNENCELFCIGTVICLNTFSALHDPATQII